MSTTHPSNLPPEILSNIFLLYKTATVGANNQDDLKWIAITHVCRSWRDAALGFVALWTGISLARPRLVDTMVKRSKNCPLSINLSGRLDAARYHILANLLSHPSYPLRAIEITIDQRQRDYPLSEALRRMRAQAPSLERLTLVSQGDGIQVDERLPPGFALDAPLLATLHIENLGMQWCMLPLGEKLVHLHLHQGRHTELELPRVSWDVLFQHLSHLPILETLDLRSMLPRRQSDVPIPPIILGNLERVSLRDESQAIAAFFHHISLPRIEFVFVGVMDQGQPVLSDDPLLNVDRCFANMKNSFGMGGASRSSHWMNGGVEGLVISRYLDNTAYHRYPILKFKLRESPRGMEDPRGILGSTQDPPVPCTISVVGLSSTPCTPLALRSEVMDSINKHFDLSSLSHLSISADKSHILYLSTIFQTIFAASTQVRRVTLDDASVFDQFLQALGRKGLDTCVAAYPTLEVLHLRNVDLSWRGDTRGAVADLVAALSSKPSPYRLKKLILSECMSFTAEGNLELERAVDGLEVDWDGKGRLNEDGESGELKWLDMHSCRFSSKGHWV